MVDEYLEQFLGEVEDPEEKKKQESEWFNSHPTALAAYEAINELDKIKRRYIKGHFEKKHFKKKALWKIKKTEVANRIDKTMQPLFNQNTFSGELAKYFDSINKKLQDLVDEKKKLTLNQRKSILDKKCKSTQSDLNSLRQQTCEDLFSKLLAELPLDIKKKLKLN